MQNLSVRITTRIRLFLPFLALLIGLSSGVSAQDGEALFKANCAACHKITNQKLVGPGLAGVEERWPEKENLYAWIKNSQKYMKESGDEYAIALFEEYNQSIMPPQAVNNEEIDAILDYIANPPVEVAAATQQAAESTEDVKSNPILWVLVLVVILLIVSRVLATVSRNLENLNRVKNGEEPLPEEDMLQATKGFFKKNMAVTVVLGLLVVGYILVLTWDGLQAVGVATGYQPTQPIWFSHKIHAGQNGINCVYCHNSVEKSKSAGIPSVNICMNCHMAVQEGKVSGKGEIAKIYDAIGWDPDALEYIEGYDQKPIEWVRIHNLQDFVYFNHSQHVVVGKQECTTCHGPIQEMDEVYQYSSLTMGWCINCHRETQVTMKDNGYYDELHAELVEKYKEEGIDKFTVEQIGGLECGKCHY